MTRVTTLEMGDKGQITWVLQQVYIDSRDQVAFKEILEISLTPVLLLDRIEKAQSIYIYLLLQINGPHGTHSSQATSGQPIYSRVTLSE